MGMQGNPIGIGVVCKMILKLQWNMPAGGLFTSPTISMFVFTYEATSCNILQACVHLWAPSRIAVRFAFFTWTPTAFGASLNMGIL